jgi:beta-glucosidase
MAATWNPELIQQVGEALGEETLAKGAHILLAPTVNIHRSPLAGRNFECYSEDPYLTSRMAVAYIQGVQSQGVGACIKHFVCNDSEFERHSLSSEVSERALREIYLYPFQVAVREAQPWSLMSAYNKVNGVSCSENHYVLEEILKGEWGFDGIVMSDWLGTYSPNAAAGGLDLEMPGPAKWMSEKHITAALESGALSEANLDDKVARVLRTIFRVGAFDDPEIRPEQAIDKPEHRKLARQTASEAIVLLKNEAILPLDTEKTRSIAVIGPTAKQAQIMGGGSSQVNPHYAISPLEGIQNRAGDGDGKSEAIQVHYALGTPIHRALPLLDAAWLKTKAGETGLRVQFHDNLDLSGKAAGEVVTDRMDYSWADDILREAGVTTNRFSARMTGTLTPPESGEYRFSLAGNGVYRLYIDGQMLVDHWPDRSQDEAPWDGSEKAGAIQMVAGQAYALEIEYAWEGAILWRSLRIGCLPPMRDNPIAEAVALAKKCDVAVVVAGLTNEWESEGQDRVNMDLPGEQEALIRQVAAANPNTIVVLNLGSPLHMPWLEDVPAVLQMWFPGQENGNALADVLFGDVNPSGKLPTTFPKRLQDNPAYINYPGENGKVYYGEGLFVGYRYYDKKGIEPLFPFGFGLSYTTFEYSNLAVNSQQYKPGDEIKVSLEVKNTGERPGKEVVQLYMRDLKSSLARPPKELKAFAKIMLAPGETQQVDFILDPQALAFYDDRRQAWVVEAGTFEVLVGSSSQDIRLKGQFEWLEEIILSQKDKTPRLHISLPLQVLLGDEAGKAVIEKHLAPMLEHPQLAMAMQMTLEQIAQFAPNDLTPELLQAINDDLAKI